MKAIDIRFLLINFSRSGIVRKKYLIVIVGVGIFTGSFYIKKMEPN